MARRPAGLNIERARALLDDAQAAFELIRPVAPETPRQRRAARKAAKPIPQPRFKLFAGRKQNDAHAA